MNSVCLRRPAHLSWTQEAVWACTWVKGTPSLLSSFLGQVAAELNPAGLEGGRQGRGTLGHGPWSSSTNVRWIFGAEETTGEDM